MAQKGQIIKVDLHQLPEVSYKHPDPNTFFSVFDYIRHSNISKSDSKIVSMYHKIQRDVQRQNRLTPTVGLFLVLLSSFDREYVYGCFA